MPIKKAADQMNYFFIVFFSGLLVACQSPAIEKTSPTITEMNPGVQSANEVDIALNSALIRAKQQREFAVMALAPAQLNAQPSVNINIRWEGEAATILKKIAQQQNLKFKITGQQPYLPLPVFINLKGVTVVQTLEAIGDQTGGRATVILRDDEIELKMGAR